MENNNQGPKYDPAGETKQKLLFFAVAFGVILILKIGLGW